MGFKDIINKVRSWFSGNQRERRTGMPPRYAATTWNQGARKFGVGGWRNKLVQRIENNKPTKTYYPYAMGHITNAIEEVLSQPVWDETGGSSEPVDDHLMVHDPGLIAYDQSRLKRE